MPRFEPFAGLRYTAGTDLSHLTCPPYDVIDAGERLRLATSDPHNAVHIEVPDPDEGEERYHRAGRRLKEWRAEGALALETEASLYGYRMTPPGGSPTFGYLGALGVTDADGLLPHERTTPKARSDRLDLLREARVNTSPIWALSLAEGLAGIWQPSTEPIARSVDGDEVVHELWRVPSEAARRVSETVSAAPAAVADGHHRWETARAYLSENPGDRSAELILALVVELSRSELEVRPIHRIVRSLPEGAGFPEALDPWFELVDPDQAEIRLLTPGSEHGLRARPATREAADHDADAEHLQVALDGLGAADVDYQHDAAAVAAAVSTGAPAGLILRPVGVEVISAAARAAERFPPKTTFFWPKPLTGFVFRSLDD